MPHDPEMERMLIGLILERETVLEHPGVTEALVVGHDTLRAFRVLRERFGNGEANDWGAIAMALAEVGVPDARSFVIGCTEAAQEFVLPGVLKNLQHVAKRRLYWRAARELDGLLIEEHPEGERETVEHVATTLQLGLAGQTVKGPRAAPLILADYIEQVNHSGGVPGLRTGFAVLDRVLGGLRPGELTILAARTSVGKSALAVQVARSVAMDGHHVLYATPEMSETQVAERLASSATGMPSHNVRRGPYPSDTMATLVKAAEQLPMTLAIWDATGITTADVAVMARQHQASVGLGLLVVDHLGFLADRLGRGESRALLMGRMTKALKTVARSLGVHALVLHQLNRQSEEGGTMRAPGLSDLRDSGCIEEDADNVLLLHRETREHQEATLIVAKNRQGPVGDVPLLFQPETTVFLPRRVEARAV